MTTPPYTLTIERVRTALDQTFGEIDGWFDRPEALRGYKPASGGWSIDEVLEHVTLTSHYLRIVYGECVDILDRLRGGAGTLHKVRMSVNGSGRLDVYQWLYFLAQHAARHIDQMRENEAEWPAIKGART
jgi:hypothetical protein